MDPTSSSASKASSKNVIVVGMPRSGTSMVAGIFARHGYFAAEDPDAELREGDSNNPFGYWEAESLTTANADIFAAAGYPEHNSWLGAAAPADLAASIRRLEPMDGHRDLVATYDARSPWMWKDPRLCYTLGYWWPLIPRDSTRVLLTERDPEAIWQSFVRLHWREPSPEAEADVLARIEAHLSAARSSLQVLNIPHLVVRYEDFSREPEGMARRISDFVSLDLAPEGIGFSRELDHSSTRGRLANVLERSYERLPSPLRRLAKRLTPRALIRTLFPERYMGR